ncbi:unnamed protein product [Dibothriocephalus latus]|uniref:Uncharacterized protein n=1 Tax=Dibothriocephalus latus TaxID=60516 RepID=A0A3P6QKM8_DIBLA|nr:unnamed protein product [Dibothriocephalus latus]
MTPIKASLLDETLRDITIWFDRGVNYLNWDSLAIDDFLEQAEKKIKLLEYQLKELDRNRATLNKVCATISAMKLFKQISKEYIVSAKEYMDYAESTRETDMEELATTVQSMLKNSLSKLEEALYDTNTNRCKKMAVVYQMCEQLILEALVNVSRFLSNNLLIFCFLNS